MQGERVSGRASIRLAVTGGIACGKSLVGGFLAEQGVAVLDTDAVVHELLRRDRPLIEAVTRVFGAGVADAMGGIDRVALGHIAFADAERRAELNRLVHPRVRQELEAWLTARAAGSDGPLAVLIPLLYEVGWAKGWDRTICVAAPRSVQRARLCERGLTDKEADARLEAQLPVEEKMRRATYVVYNAGTKAEAQSQVARIVRDVTERGG